MRLLYGVSTSNNISANIAIELLVLAEVLSKSLY